MAGQAGEDAPALSSLSVDQVIKDLGKSASDSEVQVHCGGSVTVEQPLKLFTGAQQFELPLSQDDLRQLKLLCEPASFGKGHNETLDPEHRQALKLSSHKAAFNFDLSNWPILAQVKQVLMPHTDKHIIARVDKVNLYTAGGFFKAHKDTPRSNTMFGSLVLCLPSPFEGGQLVIKHKSGETSYDWSSDSNDSKFIQWAAFYSDCTHEILPVKEGVRVTVHTTCSWDSKTLQDHLTSATTKFLGDLSKAISEPGFMSDGGILGFACEHTYPREEKVAGLAGFLKGADAVVFAAPNHLKLNPTLQPIWKGGEYYPDSGSEHDVEGDVLGDTFDAQMCDIWEENFVLQIHSQMKGEIDMKDVTWCTGDRRAWSEDHAVATYGNEPASNTVYSAAAITVDVSPWSEGAVS